MSTAGPPAWCCVVVLILLSSLLYWRYISRSAWLDVVVARYAESLDWLQRLPCMRGLLHRVTIYNKGPDDLDPALVASVRAVLRLPNVGRCDHTYLTHLVRGLANDSLAPVTVFVSGSVTAERRKLLALSHALWRARHNVTSPQQHPGGPPLRDPAREFADFALDEWASSTAVNWNHNPDKKMQPACPRPFGAWFRSLRFPTYVPGRLVPIHLGGVVPAFRDKVKRSPLSLYRELLRQCGEHPNPEVGHYIERVWGLLVDA